MHSEGRIAGRGVAPRPASEGRREYSAALVTPPAHWSARPSGWDQCSADFAAAWVADRYGVPISLAGTVAALAGLGGLAR